MSDPTGKSVVRDLRREDLTAVARLFQATFRRRKNLPPSLAGYLHEVFFEHPWYDEELSSKVFVDGRGDITGFVGVFPARLELNGQYLRAAFAGTMMVDRPDCNPLAGARLLRAFLAGPQDISLTETANTVALGMWQKLALPLELAYSLNWLRVFRPASMSVQLMERTSSAAALLRPFANLTDHFGERLGLSSFRTTPISAAGRIRFEDVDEREFASRLLTLKDMFSLRPQWDRQSLAWFLQQGGQKHIFGRPFWRIATNRTGEVVGCYAYFGRPGHIAWLLQALCSADLANELVDDLFAHADKLGCAGIRGGGHPWLIPALISRKTVFYGRAFFIAHAKDDRLLQPIRSGGALVSGLAGENWTRLIGDHFD